MPPIQPNIDAYGKYARASALADYLELRALLGQPILRSALEDVIEDGWDLKAGELFIEGVANAGSQDVDDEDVLDPESDVEAESSVDEEPAAKLSRRVFDLLNERAEILEDDYPFVVNDDSVQRRADLDASASMYVAVLSIALAHAYAVDVTDDEGNKLDVKQSLEETVTRAVGAVIRTVINVGEVSRAENDFPSTVKKAAIACGLRPSPLAAVHKKSANEEGVDVLGHLPVGDQRPGVWTFLGQVTCAKSEAWESKIGEPKGPPWQMRLNAGVEPQAFLAVPHHVEPAHLEYLVSGNKRIVIDRLRLVRLAEDPSAEEQRIAAAVLQTGVEQLT